MHREARETKRSTPLVKTGQGEYTNEITEQQAERLGFNAAVFLIGLAIIVIIALCVGGVH